MGKVRLFPFSEPVLLFLLFLVFLIFVTFKIGFENLVPNTLTDYRIIISFAYIPVEL